MTAQRAYWKIKYKFGDSSTHFYKEIEGDNSDDLTAWLRKERDHSTSFKVLECLLIYEHNEPKKGDLLNESDKPAC